MAKKNISAIETGAGLYQGLVTALMNVVRANGVPFEAIYRLATPGGDWTLKKIVKLAHEEWLAMQPPSEASISLPPDHYRVLVTYAPIPSMDALKQKWGKDNVSPIFDGRPFTLHASCQDMDRTPGEKVFYLHDAGHDWESEEQIAWGAKQRNESAPNGYRPATEQETYEFADAHPEFANFVGLGSSATRGGHRCVARVWRDGSQRILDRAWFRFRWYRGDRVLFVRK